MKLSPLLIGLASLATLSPAAFSDTILGVYAGVGIWQADVDGSANDAGNTNRLDIGDEFGSIEDDSNFLYVALEHPVPFIPNILLQQTDLSVDDSAILNSAVTIDGTTFSANTSVNTTIDFSHTDATLYYEILDNWLTLDVGMTFRMFDGELMLSDTNTPPTASATEEIDDTIPMLYAKGRFDLPLSGFYATATANFLSFGDASLTDFSAGVGYETDGWVMDLGLELGLRTFTLELDDVNDFDADIDLSGAYAALTIHF